MAQPSTPGSQHHPFQAISASTSATAAPAPPNGFSSIFGGGGSSSSSSSGSGSGSGSTVPATATTPAAPALASTPIPTLAAFQASAASHGNGLGSGTGSGTGTPASTASSSNNTYVMPNTPMKHRTGMDGYRPTVTRTLGQRPACLVNASVTYCGNNQIYAFGGFDQYTDEVYNHVLRLDLVSQQWNLVDNYGDIPGVRMGHTATLYQGDKLLVFGGENEHRTYLSDLIVFDLKTAHWTQPQVSGPIPKGRARHAAVLHEDKLFIIGGITGQNNYVLDDICYLDLKTFNWSRTWRFVGRFDHSAYIWGDRVWVFGGLSEDMDKVSDLWWLDLKGSPAFQSPPQVGSFMDRHNLHGVGGGGGGSGSGSGGRHGGSPRPGYAAAQSSVVGASGYAANSRTAQVNTPSFQLKSYAPVAPGAISALKFFSGPSIPNQGSGIHFHVYSSGMLLDFVTPAPTITSRECSLSTLDLVTLRWQKLAEGREVFKSGYRWHYCTMNEDGTKAWLLGCPTGPGSVELGANGLEEYLSDIMEIDLRRFGFLGHTFAPESPTGMLARPSSRVRHADPPSKGLGADLARLFDQPPETGSGTDFIVTAHSGNWEDEDALGSALVATSGGGGDDGMSNGSRSSNNVNNNNNNGSNGNANENGDNVWLSPDAPTSPPIHVHRLILQARWPHFARLWSSQMAEFHTKKMHIPEPYSVVRAFLFYLYTDRIDPETPSDDGGIPMAAGGGGDASGFSGGGNSGSSSSRSNKGGLRTRSGAGGGGGESSGGGGFSSGGESGHGRGSVTGDLADVAGLLVMANIYNIPHLRLLCVNRLAQELDVEHACIIWHCASLANEEWLRQRAAAFCLTHWGRIVRSSGFLRLPRAALVELSQEIDTEGRVVGGDELDLYGSGLLEGGRYDDGGSVASRRKESISSHPSQMAESEMEDEDSMEMT